MRLPTGTAGRRLPGGRDTSSFGPQGGWSVEYAVDAVHDDLRIEVEAGRALLVVLGVLLVALLFLGLLQVN